MCDEDLGRVSKLPLEGKVLGWFGPDGSEPGQLRQVHSIAVARDGAIYSAEMVNGRIQNFVCGDCAAASRAWMWLRGWVSFPSMCPAGA